MTPWLHVLYVYHSFERVWMCNQGVIHYADIPSSSGTVKCISNALLTNFATVAS